MTAFLLVGSRPLGGPERSPALAARDAAALMTWHRGLRQWGLLRSFALPDEDGSALRLCLIVQVSGADAAQRLAMRWERLGGYQVTVLALREVAERRAS
ncbi:MAG: hypothetical protein ACTHJW_07020 [Streptosporangiaceae bacterium]